MKLEDKVAIVAGGDRGNGATICRRYADEGARVAVAVILNGGPSVPTFRMALGPKPLLLQAAHAVS